MNFDIIYLISQFNNYIILYIIINMSIKKQHYTFINNISKIIENIDLESNLEYDKCYKIYKIYKNIEKKINKCDIININDINIILLNDNINDDNINRLRKFINIKNFYILKNICNSLIWKQFIIKLYEIFSLDNQTFILDNSKEYKIKILEKAVFKLLKKYINHFNGCWEIVKFEKNKIKKIDIIEPEHFDFINNYLKNFISSP